MKVRVKFTKYGATKFIGHLDIMHYFQKAMRRADVDIEYSEGSSPRQVMSLTVPLGVGLISNGKYTDIEVNPMKGSKTMVHQLNEVTVEGTEVLSCRRLKDTAKNAMSMVTVADYTVRPRDRARPDDMNALFEGLISFYGQESIVITKKIKRGEREVDLKSLIYGLHREGDVILLQLSIESSDNIKPELVLEAPYSGKRQTSSELDIQVQWKEVYGNIGDEEHRVLIPLENFGEDIE